MTPPKTKAIGESMVCRCHWLSKSTGRRVMAKIDTRHDYGEVRKIGYAVLSGRLYCVVFTQRGHTMHIISFRKANSREVQNYVEQTQADNADT